MNCIKIKIKPLSAFKSKLQSDTIFGNFCWMYRYLYGEEKFIEILNDYLDNPFIIFSDGFFEDYLPLPILKPAKPSTVEKTIANFTKDKELQYSLIKKLKKINFIHIEEITDYLTENNLKEELIIVSLLQSMFDKKGNLKDDNISPSVATYSLLKNSVNRIHNTTTEGLYISKEYFIKGNLEFYVKYNLEKLSQIEITEVLEAIGKTGFGADKSTGKGRFEIVSIEEDFEIKEYLLPESNKDKNGFISLSSGLLTDDNITLNFGKTFTKFGKLGGDRAITGKYLKNPLILYKSGTTFFVKEHKEYYGNATDKVFKNQDGFHSGYMIPLFINLERS